MYSWAIAKLSNKHKCRGQPPFAGAWGVLTFPPFSGWGIRTLQQPRYVPLWDCNKTSTQWQGYNYVIIFVRHPGNRFLEFEGIAELWVSPKQRHIVIPLVISAVLDVGYHCSHKLLSAVPAENVSIERKLFPRSCKVNKLFQLATVLYRLCAGVLMWIFTLP